MKRVVLLLMLGAFLVTGSVIFARQDFMVNCCVGGQCSKMTAPACQKLKGRVVGDCSQCR
jgi:hypothetical protein